jgi:hypothetical protein
MRKQGMQGRVFNIAQLAPSLSDHELSEVLLGVAEVLMLRKHKHAATLARAAGLVVTHKLLGRQIAKHVAGFEVVVWKGFERIEP